nr:uroporphyrinogen decarboxylase family protein [Candidatus Njordarchaeota archaeon]
MDPRDRLITILEKREPDCVPIVFQSILSWKVAQKLTEATGCDSRAGRSFITGGLDYEAVREFIDSFATEHPSDWKEEYTKMANVVAKAPINVDLYMKLGIDGFYYSSTPGDVRVLNKEHILNEFGSISKFGDAGGELILWYDGGYLKTPEQRDQWALPLPGPDCVENYKDALETCSNKVYPIGFIVGIQELTWESMGFVEYARYLRTNPEFIRRVYSEHAKFDEELAKLFIDAGAEVLAIGDDVAYKRNLMIPPKLWAEFVQPLASRIVNTIHKRGALVFMHSDGYITPLIDLIIKTGYDGLQSLEPLAGVNLGEVKEKYGDKLALIGGIDTSQLLPYGSEEDVGNAVKQAIRAAAKGGGYAIGPCTEIHWKCKPENVLAMIKYARKYGKYPLRL